MENRKSSTWLIAGIVIVIAILLALVWCYKTRHQPKVCFENLKDGAQVESPFKVEMTAKNLVVEPATNGVVKGHGHFHIIIDSPLPPTGEPVPMDSLHLHYGKGQTSAMVSLPDGDHILTLQFADGNHFPYDPQVTQTIHIRVTKQNPPSVITDSAKTGSTKMDEEASTVTTKTTTITHSATAMPAVKKGAAKPDSIHTDPSNISPGYGGGGMGGGGMGGSGGTP